MQHKQLETDVKSIPKSKRDIFETIKAEDWDALDVHLEKKDNLNVRNANDDTPLLFSARCSYFNICLQLLELGANPYFLNNLNESFISLLAISGHFQDINNIKKYVDINAPIHEGLSTTAFLVRENKFQPARLLIECGARLTDVCEILAKQEDKKNSDRDKLIKVISDLKDPAFVVDRMHYEILMKTAIIEDDVEEVKYLEKALSQKVIDYIDLDSADNGIFLAIKVGALKVLQYGLGSLKNTKGILAGQDESYPDFYNIEANSLAMVAAKWNREAILNFLFDQYVKFPSDLNFGYRNQHGKTIFDMTDDPHILDILKKKQQDLLQIKNALMLCFFPCRLTISAFIYQLDNPFTVTTKGLALLLHYHARKRNLKKRTDLRLHYAPCSAELFERAQIVQGAVPLMEAVNQFAKSTEGRLLLISTLMNPLVQSENDNSYITDYGHTNHHKIVYLEKKEGTIHIVIVDSYVGAGEKNEVVFSLELVRQLATLLRINFPDIFPRIKIWVNKTNQQSDVINCPFFTIKNATLIARYENFLSEVQSRFLTQEICGAITLNYYQLPTVFMHLANYGPLRRFLANHKTEAEEVLRIKNGECQTLQQYAFTKREGTPLLEENKKYNSAAPSKDEPPHIMVPHTIEYFREKYLRIILQMFTQTPKAELRKIVARHDINHFFHAAPASKGTDEKKEVKLLAKLSSFAPVPDPAPPALPPAILMRRVM